MAWIPMAAAILKEDLSMSKQQHISLVGIFLFPNTWCEIFRAHSRHVNH